MHEQSESEGHIHAPISKVLLTVHSGTGVWHRKTHESGQDSSWAGSTMWEPQSSLYRPVNAQDNTD